MSMTLTSGRNPPRKPDDSDRRRTRIVKRASLAVVALGIVGFAAGALVIFGWMVGETHFDRPSPQFDDYGSQLEKLPGVDAVAKERWVEAPTFSNPTSWMSVIVDEAGLPGLLDAACSTDYPDAVTWSIQVRTAARAGVWLSAVPAAPDSAGGDAQCPDFGFDAVRLVEELTRVAPGLAIQPISDDGRLTLVALEEMPTGLSHLLPLVEHADELLAAAGFDADDVVEINAAKLGFILEPGESDEYLALLTELAEDGAVSSYWADGGGTPVDGIDKVQIVAPDEQHAAIEKIIRSSGLHIADLPLRFIEQ